MTSGRYVERLRSVLPNSVQRPVRSLVKGYRRLTAALRVTPDFLVIGARKCGTTSLYRYLAEHPCVLPALTKEVFYFNARYDQGESWYRSYFPTALEMRVRRWWTGVKPLTGEATPTYINCPSCPIRVHKLNPEMKLLVVLRDPVDAVYSAYHFGIARGTYTADDLPFDHLVAEELRHLREAPVRPDCAASLLLPRYFYYQQLVNWREVFPPEQIRVVILESFAAAPQQEYDRVLEFLGLPPHRLAEFEAHNKTRYAPMDDDLRAELAEFYQPHNARLQDYLGVDLPWGRQLLERDSRPHSWRDDDGP